MSEQAQDHAQESEQERAARKEAEKNELYAMDISGVTWVSAGGDPAEGQVELAFLEGGAVAMRNSAEPEGPVLRYTAAEWRAFQLGAIDGEFDI
ncbi:DUF397 domain-containing protein [Streptomyces sp. NBC_01262]|jgi:hypothetical protein|uniref:DUF397 domain-containing protein n=1 Tax=Streptomyces sp. NBC_01262 TaxID=2903803 RepID=UPI002E2FB07C|nr:DUF397 domain-containing protein [Streptomyces sp. NBC_01262]